MRKILLPVILICLTVPLVAATLQGVTLPDSATVAGKSLVLNGLGLRTKKIAFVGVNVYMGGLYVEAKSKDGNAIIQLDAPKRVVLQFLRDVSRDQMVEAFTEGFSTNLPDKGASVKAQIDQLLKAVVDIKETQQFIVTYVPETGTTLTINGQDKVTIPGLPLAKAVFSLWLGPKPPNDALKDGMLGKGKST